MIAVQKRIDAERNVMENVSLVSRKIAHTFQDGNL
jgi:hypothetical protein